MIHELRNSDPEQTDVIAQWFDASEDVISRVLDEPVHEDGRSDFVWIRLANGDLMLGTFPRGDFYFDIENAVAADYKKASE